MEKLWNTPLPALETMHFYDNSRIKQTTTMITEHLLMSPKFGEVYVVNRVSSANSNDMTVTVNILYAKEVNNSKPTIYRPMTQHSVPKSWIISSISTESKPKAILYHIVNSYASDCDMSLYNRFRVEYAMSVDTTNQDEIALLETFTNMNGVDVLETEKIIYVNLGLIDLLRVLKQSKNPLQDLGYLSLGLPSELIEFMKDYCAYLRV